MYGTGDNSVPSELKQAIAIHLGELQRLSKGTFPTQSHTKPFGFNVATADAHDEFLD